MVFNLTIDGFKIKDGELLIIIFIIITFKLLILIFNDFLFRFVRRFVNLFK
jgi:hypothetical protein